MTRTIELSGGPVTVDAHAGGVLITRDWGEVRELFVFANGMTACLDKDGNQMPAVQAPLVDLIDELWKLKGGE